MKKNLFTLTVLLFLSFQAPAAGPIVISGTGNPASVLCDKIGGTFLDLKEQGSTTTMCNLDGALVEQWTLYQAIKHDEQPEVIQAFLKSADCQSSGGEISKLHEKNSNSPVYLCNFPDGSSMSLKTFEAGIHAQENRTLAKAIIRK